MSIASAIRIASLGFLLAVSGCGGGGGGAPAPAPAGLSISGASALEGDSGSVSLVFEVRLQRPAGDATAVTVDYATGGGMAAAGVDYSAATGALAFGAGETLKTIIVSATGDAVDEVDETFQVTLSNPTGAPLVVASATGTITDDDGPTVSIGDAAVSEGNVGNATLSFAVSLSAVSPQEVRVAYATAAGTATAGVDFIATSGTLVFATGEVDKTIPITMIGDAAVEPSETLVVNLGAPVGATLADTSATGTITNDDIPPQPPSGWTGSTVSTSLNNQAYEIWNGNVALNDSGVGAAVWVQEFDSDIGSDVPRIWTNRFVNGTWATPTEIGGSNSFQPQIALAPNGKAVAVWEERGQDANGNIVNSEIHARAHNNVAWGATVKISVDPSTPNRSFAYAPVLVWDTATTAVVAWYQNGSLQQSIWAARFDGSAWSAPVRISTGERRARVPALATDRAGRSVIAWSQDTNLPDGSQPGGYATPNAWVSVYSSGAWSGPQRIGRSDQVTFDSASPHDVAMNVDGKAVVVIGDQHGGVSTIHAVHYDPVAQSWSAPVGLGSDFSVDRATVDLDPAGNALAVWMARNSSGLTRLPLRHYDVTTGAWSAAVFVDDGVDDTFAPHVGMDDTGNAVISWDANFDDGVVRARRYLAGSGLSATVTDFVADDENALAVNATGQALITGDNFTFSSTAFLTTLWGFFFSP